MGAHGRRLRRIAGRNNARCQAGNAARHAAGKIRWTLARHFPTIALLAGTEGNSCTTALLAGRKGLSYAADRAAARLRCLLEERDAATR